MHIIISLSIAGYLYFKVKLLLQSYAAIKWKGVLLNLQNVLFLSLRQHEMWQNPSMHLQRLWWWCLWTLTLRRHLLLQLPGFFPALRGQGKVCLCQRGLKLCHWHHQEEWLHVLSTEKVLYNWDEKGERGAKWVELVPCLHVEMFYSIIQDYLLVLTHVLPSFFNQHFPSK